MQVMLLYKAKVAILLVFKNLLVEAHHLKGNLLEPALKPVSLNKDLQQGTSLNKQLKLRLSMWLRLRLAPLISHSICQMLQLFSMINLVEELHQETSFRTIIKSMKEHLFKLIRSNCFKTIINIKKIFLHSPLTSLIQEQQALYKFLKVQWSVELQQPLAVVMNSISSQTLVKILEQIIISIPLLPRIIFSPRIFFLLKIQKQLPLYLTTSRNKMTISRVIPWYRVQMPLWYLREDILKS